MEGWVFGFFNITFDFDGASIYTYVNNYIRQILFYIYPKTSGHLKILQAAYFIYILSSKSSMKKNHTPVGYMFNKSFS